MNFTNPHFAEPAWLWLAFFGPAALFALHRYSSWMRRRQLEQVAGREVLAGLTGSHSAGRRRIKEGLLLIVVALGGFAMARPQWGEQADAWRLLGQDMVFVLDASRSMLAADIAPSRLQRAKLSILDYVQHHGRGRVGLVAFAGQAFLQCPLTFDYGAFQETLAAVDEKTIPVPGTDIGRALEEAYLAMDKSERQKLLVLLTDGEDLEKGGIQTAQKLAKNGVIVFTLGIGTPAGAEIQVTDERGQVSLVRDAKGQIVRSRLDEATLRGIATATRGAYYPLGPLGEGLERVRVTVETQRLGSSSAPARKFGVERFHFFVAALLVLLVAESLLGTRKRVTKTARRPARAGGDAMRALRVGTAVLAVVSVATLGAAPPPDRIVTADPEPTPQSARDFYNSGTRKLAQRKYREAEALLETALAKQTETVQPGALYNLGHVRFAQGLDELQKGPGAAAAEGRGNSAVERGQSAIEAADEALASEQVKAMVAAYMRGRGTRRELKAATEAVKQALQAHGNTLQKWQRASGDFHSALELNPADKDARQNAYVVDRHIAKLVDAIQQLQQMANALGQTGEELKEKMKQLKGRIPQEDMPPGAAGDEDEEQDMPMGDEPTQKETPGKEGEEMKLTPEQAGWLLEGFKLDKERRLPMGQQEAGEPKKRNRPTW